MVKARKLVSMWLLICIVLIAAMIALGGYTRLSGSGLSITEWHPISGFIPPINSKDWQEEFDLYSKSPEFIQKNFSITLHEFKQIFLIEYLHRLLGRLTGIIFIMPLLYFWHTHRLLKKEKITLLFTLILGTAQGFIGWYMVKSGLIDDPHVSHYRLTLHMLIATTIYGILFWIFLSTTIPNITPKKLSISTSYCTVLLLLCFIQIGLGAMVAGLKAGLIYNTFPLMNGRFFPIEIEKSIITGSFFRDPTTMQFLHRMLGFILLAYSLFFLKKSLSIENQPLYAIRLLFLAISTQFALGVLTLIKYAPLNLALLHQCMAIAVFTILLFILHRLVYNPKA